MIESPVVQTRKMPKEGMGFVTTFEILFQDAQFISRHVHYTCRDPSVGVVHCFCAKQSAQISAHVLSSAGSVSFSGLEHRPRKACAQLPAHLTHNPEYQALVSVMSEYLAHISVTRRQILQRGCPTRDDWLESFAVRLVSSMEVFKGVTAMPAFKGFLGPKCSKSFTVDVIASRDSPITSLLPDATIPKDNDVEINKFPDPADQEAGEKRDNLLLEILTTERTYVARLQHLQKDYAIPLRTAARKQRGILGTYETNNMFPSTLDAIVLLNQDFLRSLEGCSGDYEFALTLVNGFRDFAKVYARYLETSSELDQIVRDSMRDPKFREFADSARASASASIGIRELVMEPISRIPRYSLLITSLLGVLASSNPSYPVFKEALVAVRRIGYMERDKKEVSQEVIMKLSSLVSSWPTQLVRSTTRVIGFVDCMDNLPPYGLTSDGSDSNEGNPCSLVLFADRIVILKRGRGTRLEDVLQRSRKGDLGYRGYALLDTVVLIEGEDSMHLVLKTEVCGVNSDRWLNRPLRRFSLLSSDAMKFSKQVQTAQFELKICEQNVRQEKFDRFQIRYAVYSYDKWDSEHPQRQCSIKVWEDVDDGNNHSHNLVLTNEPGKDSWTCFHRHGSKTLLVCREVPRTTLRDLLCQRLIQLQYESWLSPAAIDEDVQASLLGNFAESLLLNSSAAGSSPSKPRPVSPVKLMSSFLGRKDRDGLSRPGTAATLNRVTTGLETSPTHANHTILKKKSNQLFSFVSEDRSLLGLEAFVSSILAFDSLSLSDFSSPTTPELKQVNSLITLITKDAKKTFAVLGSPSKVALHAFKGYCNSTLAKKMTINVVLPDTVVQNLRAHLRHDTETRLTRMKVVVSALPAQNLNALRSILRAGNHLLRCSDDSCKVKCLLLVSETLVSPINTTSFVETLELLLRDYDGIFGARLTNHDTLSSVTSGMSLQPLSSRFGSVSSHSQSQYTTDSGTLSSPAKDSSFGGTPDLIYGTESTDEANSITRSRSDSSMDHKEIEMRYKRATIQVDTRFEKDNVFGLRVPDVRPSSYVRDRNSSVSSVEVSTLLEATSDKVRQYAAPKEDQSGMDPHVRDASPVRSILPEPEPPFMQDNLTTETHGRKLSHALSMDNLDRRKDSNDYRRVTPSKIPILSPRLSTSATFPMFRQRYMDGESDETRAGIPAVTSKKGSSIPRLPSTLVKRRESQGLTKIFSNHSFTFDTEATADLRLALEYSMDEEEAGEDHTEDADMPASNLRRSDSTVDKSLEERQRRMSREYLKKELASDSRMSSASTIRRISRQLQNTQVGALEIPLPPIPVAWQSTFQTPASKPSPVPEALSPKNAMDTEAFNGCTVVCQERYDMLRLELQHYKNLYRQSVEEIDMTLDVANEQLADLQSSLESGTLEATALALLELEKEKNRKLVLQIGEHRIEHIAVA